MMRERETLRGQGIAAYSAADSQAREKALIDEHTTLVRRIAHHLAARLPSTVQVDDLIQAGIRGAMLDEIRRGDWAPRSVHRNAREIARAIRAVESRTGREAQDKEVAAELAIPLEDYYRMLKDASGSKLFSYEELTETSEPPDPLMDAAETGAALDAPPFVERKR